MAALAHEHNLDVIILSECNIAFTDFLIRLNKPVKRKYGFPDDPKGDPVIITRFPRESLQRKRDSRGVSIRRLTPPIGPDILITAVHIPSKLYHRDIDQAMLSTRLPHIIEDEEKKVGHRRTLVVGDFNMNPFEPGVAGSEGLHAVMARNLAERGSRTVGGEERCFLYNPMWNHFGDYPSGPPGTYFYDASASVNYYWNMFEQVMLRPDLLAFFRDDSLQILTWAGSTSLLNPLGRPDPKVASDHLPIMFDLELHKGVANVP